MTGGWRVERLRGSAAQLHDRALPDRIVPEVWWLETDGPALVLGSTQDPAVVDLEAVARAGVEVARRRSGGGAVLVVPGEVTWLDVLLPADDPRWHDDVGRSFDWLGGAWRRALAGLGVDGLAVHPGPLERAPWSQLVCFGGLGPGEVTLPAPGGSGARAKVVGIAQRRTRAGARYQCALLHRWAPEDLVGLLALSAADRAAAVVDLQLRGAGIDLDPAAVVEALVSELDRSA